MSRLRRAKALPLLLIAIAVACRVRTAAASAGADVPAEDAKPETAAELAAFEQKERDRTFYLPSNATVPPPGNGTTAKTNPLGGIKQIIFVRHGEHAWLRGNDTPCDSEVGVARGLMLTRYLTHPDAPRGVLQPNVVFAMNGDTATADPPTVRTINTAIPFVVSQRIPPERFVTKFGQKRPQDVAAAMLREGSEWKSDKSLVILNVWLHWECPAIMNFMGIPTTGWNNDDLDDETQATYKPAIVVTTSEKGVRTQLFHTPPINRTTLLPELPWSDINKVHWESFTTWEEVARQQGNIDRVIPPKKSAERKEKKER